MKFVRNNKKKGFTLIELIVVIAILGILAAVLIPSFSGIQDTAAKQAVQTEGRTVATAIQTYRAAKNAWPSAVSELYQYGVTSAMTTGSNSIGLNDDGTATYTDGTWTVSIGSDGVVGEPS